MTLNFCRSKVHLSVEALLFFLLKKYVYTSLQNCPLSNSCKTLQYHLKLIDFYCIYQHVRECVHLSISDGSWHLGGNSASRIHLFLSGAELGGMLYSRFSESPSDPVHFVNPSNAKKEKILCIVWVFPCSTAFGHE